MESAVELRPDQPPATRLTLHLLSSRAAHEAAMISERTKSALQAARARGVSSAASVAITALHGMQAKDG